MNENATSNRSFKSDVWTGFNVDHKYLFTLHFKIQTLLLRFLTILPLFVRQYAPDNRSCKHLIRAGQINLNCAKTSFLRTSPKTELPTRVLRRLIGPMASCLRWNGGVYLWPGLICCVFSSAIFVHRNKYWADFSILEECESERQWSTCLSTKRPNLKLKTRPEQLLHCIPLSVALPPVTFNFSLN
jgi:hypothetical protein